MGLICSRSLFSLVRLFCFTVWTVLILCQSLKCKDPCSDVTGRDGKGDEMNEEHYTAASSTMNECNRVRVWGGEAMRENVLEKWEEKGGIYYKQASEVPSMSPMLGQPLSVRCHCLQAPASSRWKNRFRIKSITSDEKSKKTLAHAWMHRKHTRSHNEMNGSINSLC